MHHGDRLSVGQMAGWSAFGLVTGLAVGVTLGALAGDVNRERLTRAARRLRDQPVAHPTSAADAARAAREALEGIPALALLGIEVLPISLHAVELRGWVPSRPARSAAARAARAVPGIDKVINRILVRGEDDRAIPEGSEPSNQTA